MNTFTAFGDRLVRKADNREARIARRNLTLHLDPTRFEPQIRDSAYGGHHQRAPPVNFSLTILEKAVASRCDVVIAVMTHRRIFLLAPEGFSAAPVRRIVETGCVGLLQAVKLIFLVSPFWFSLVQPLRAETITETVEIVETDDAPAGDYGSPALNPAAIARFGPFVMLSETQAELNGAIEADSVNQFGLMLAAFPKLARIDMIDCPGTENDEANLEIARLIRKHAIHTHVPAHGSVRSGGVELFLAGVKRTADKGAEFGVHSWIDSEGREANDVPASDPVHASYVRYYQDMGFALDVAKAFYDFTNKTSFEQVHYMTGPELAQFRILN